MISLEWARRLRAAGLRWTPQPGDRFAVDQPEMTGDTFVLSDVTAEIVQVAGSRVIGFNGTTEWALDSVDITHAIWLPAEHQLRGLLGQAFRGLHVTAQGFAVTVEINGQEDQFTAAQPADAYAAALHHVVVESTVD